MAVEPAVVVTPAKSARESAEERRDRFRWWITLILLGIFAAEVLSSLALPFIFQGSNVQAVTALIEKSLALVFGPTVALVGSATGFYFGTRVNDRESQAVVIPSPPPPGPGEGEPGSPRASTPPPSPPPGGSP